MGLAKKTKMTVTTTGASLQDGGSLSTVVESGTQAALERLKTTVAKHEVKPAYKQRDFDAEARGKVKCVMFEAALQSPALAGLQFNTIEEFLRIVEKAADAGVEYTWRP